MRRWPAVNLIEAPPNRQNQQHSESVARLIVEKGFAGRGIVVLTFTEAPPAELADRLRAGTRFAGRNAGDRLADDRFNGTRRRVLGGFRTRAGIAHDVQRERIRRALRDFDEANFQRFTDFVRWY